MDNENTFEEQEQNIKYAEEEVRKLFEYISRLPSQKSLSIPRAIVPLSPIGIIGEEYKNMHFMPWDWVVFFTHTINAIIAISMKYPKILQKRMNVIYGKQLNALNQNRDCGQRIIPFTFPLYVNGQMHFLWRPFLNKTIDWIHSYLFLASEGIKMPDKGSLCNVEGDYVFIDHKWRQYFMKSTAILTNNYMGYGNLYSAITLRYDSELQAVKGQIKLRKAWATDIYLKELLDQSNYRSVFGSLKVYNSHVVYDAIEKQIEKLRQVRAPKLDVSHIQNTVETMKSKFNKKISLDTTELTEVQKRHDDAADRLQNELSELGRYIKEDSKKLQQKTDKLTKSTELMAKIESNQAELNIKWEDKSIAQHRKSFEEIQLKEKAVRDTRKAFNEFLDAQLDEKITKSGYKSFTEIEKSYYKKKDAGEVSADTIEMEELLQEQNRRQAESFGDMRARQKALQDAKKASNSTELITTEDAKKFSKEVTDKVIDITKDYEEFERIKSDVVGLQDEFLVKAEEQIKKEFKVLVDRIIEAIRDSNARFFAIYTFRREYLISRVTSLVLELNAISYHIVKKSGGNYFSNYDRDRIIRHNSGVLSYNNQMTPYTSGKYKKTRYGDPFPCEYSSGFEVNQDEFVRELRNINSGDLDEIITTSQRGLIYAFEKIMKFIQNNGEVESEIKDVDQHYRIENYGQEDYGSGYIGRNSDIPDYHANTLKWYNKYKNILN